MPELSRFTRVPGQRLWTQDRLALILAWPLVCVFICMAVWIVTVSKIDRDKRAAVSDAQKHLTSQVADYADALSHSLQKADQVLELLRFESTSASLRLEDAARLGIFPRAQQIDAFMVDLHGTVKSATRPGLGIDAAGSDYFRFHQTQPADVLRIGPPSIEPHGLAAGQSTILLTRRIDLQNGGFGGVLALSLPRSYFDPSPTLSSLQDGDFSAVVGRDSYLRALRLGHTEIDPLSPAATQLLGRSPAFAGPSGSGSLDGATWLRDRQPRLYAWQALDGLPLVVVTGASAQNYLAAYRRLSRARINTATALSLLLSILALIGGGLSAQLIARHRREETNRTSYRIATEGGKDGFFMFLPVLDAAGRMVDLQLVDCNTRGAAMLDHQRESLQGVYWSSLWSAPALRQILDVYERAGDTEFHEEDAEVVPDAPFLKQIRWVRRRIVRTGEMFAVALSDVTDEHRLREELVTLANQDLLTDLYNRNWLINRLPELIAAASQASRQLGILFIDFDRFKQINDLMGHTAGDELLKAAAVRMSAAVGRGDHVVHMGGDEFLIILDPLASEEAARSLANHLLAEFKQPFLLARGAATINLSLGIALYPRDGEHADTLLRNADLAMHHAKSHGRGQYRFYDAWLYEIIKAKLETEFALGHGLEHDAFLLHYQPRVSAADGRLLGFEALVRWQQPGRGLVPPGEFIPLAEETGLIVQIGAHVIELACRQLADWRARFETRVPISVNVSARQFADSDVRAMLRAALAKHRLPPDAIEVEITESSMLEQDLRVYQDLLAIRDLGIKILVDDFGTGYSSLSQLQRLELDVLKIDKSFISELQRAGESEVIVNAIISMAHALQMTVVAEGVETREQLQILQQLGCDEIQGYLIARPMGAADAQACLADPLRYAAQVLGNSLSAPPANKSVR